MKKNDVCDIRVFDGDFNWLTSTDRAVSVMLDRELYGSGSFQIVLHVRDKAALSYFERGNIVIINGDPHKSGIIRDIELEEKKGLSALTLRGQTGSGFASQRISVPPTEEQVPGALGYDRINAEAETVIKHYIGANLVSPYDEKRRVPNLVMAEDLKRGSVFPAQLRYTKLSEDLRSICEYAGMGYEIYADPENKRWVCDVIEGTVRTEDHPENGPVVFSLEKLNVGESRYTENYKSYSNAGYAAGRGENERRLVQVLYPDDEPAEGAERFETFIDLGAADIDDLRYFGHVKLSGMRAVKSAEVDAAARQFVFGRDYFLGDLVTVRVDKKDIRLDARVEGVSEVWERSSGYVLKVRVGGELPNVYKLAQRNTADYISSATNPGYPDMESPEVIEEVTNIINNVTKNEIIVSDTAMLLNAWVRNLSVEFFETSFDALDARKPAPPNNKRRFMRIYGVRQDFIVAELSPAEVENYKTPDGQEIYWTAVAPHAQAYLYFTITDPATLPAAASLMPVEKEALREKFRVKVRKTLREDVKQSTAFGETAESWDYPVTTFGAGDENGFGKGYMYKPADGMYVTYTSRTKGGAEVGVRLSDDYAYYRHAGEEWKMMGSGGGGGGEIVLETNDTWYVDAVNGSDSNDGRTAGSAKKTLYGMFDMLQNKMFDNDRVSWLEINLAPGNYDSYYFEYTPQNRPIVIKGASIDTVSVNRISADNSYIEVRNMYCDDLDAYVKGFIYAYDVKGRYFDIWNNSSADLSRCEFDKISVWYNSFLTIDYCTVKNMTAWYNSTIEAGSLTVGEIGIYYGSYCELAKTLTIPPGTYRTPFIFVGEVSGAELYGSVSISEGVSYTGTDGFICVREGSTLTRLGGYNMYGSFTGKRATIDTGGRFIANAPGKTIDDLIPGTIPAEIVNYSASSGSAASVYEG